MKRKRIAALMAGMCLLLMLSGCGEQKKEAEPAATEAVEITTEPAAKKAAEITAEPEVTETAAAPQQPLKLQINADDPAPGYVLVQTGRFAGFLALPTEGEERREIRQTQEDGSEWVNVILMTPEGFMMIESDCPGHDCEQQGEVTLENMQDRVLWNMIICAPHELTLCLYTPAEAAALSKQMMGY